MASGLQPSKLGTKEYWDGAYAQEVQNFEEIGEEGEVWFGEESVEKIVDWALEHYPADQAPHILDVGTGNGSVVFALAEAGYTQTNLLGIDYSSDAVKLATLVGEKRSMTEASFRICNFLNEEVPVLEGMAESKWDLVLDKGTFDAIALAAKEDNGLSPAENYPGRIERLLKPGGVFLVTSCNFTEDELKPIFAAKGDLEYYSRIQHATFSFGGRSGSICSSIAFRKVV